MRKQSFATLHRNLLDEAFQMELAAYNWSGVERALMACANSEDLSQPVHPRSLGRALPFCIYHA